jgi:hypothetical protein
LRSGGAMILTFMEEGARAVISFCIRSERPGYMVVPPDWFVLAYWFLWLTYFAEHTMTMLP